MEHNSLTLFEKQIFSELLLLFLIQPCNKFKIYTQYQLPEQPFNYIVLQINLFFYKKAKINVKNTINLFYIMLKIDVTELDCILYIL